MTTQAISLPSRTSRLAATILVMLVGFSIVATTGLVQAEALHNVAHDVRHANGFPCH